MFKRLKNNKGVAPAGILFSGGPVIGSVFAVVMIGAVIYQLGIADNSGFQKKKAIALCEESGGAQCEQMIASWSEEDILDYIRDDEPAQIVTNGGNFVNGYMNP